MFATDRIKRQRFEQLALPHLDSAYQLARWIARSAEDAEDIVQDAYLRAFRYFDSFQGETAKPWLLSIVRHTAFTWLRRNRPAELQSFAEEPPASRLDPALAPAPPSDPETLLFEQLDRVRLDRMIEALPPQYREVLILRELEELSYKEIAEVAAVPIGTVMSRLARARRQLQETWRRERRDEDKP
jgi:RNA polymerase sigma-70 factor (ECF subfamily)